MHIPDGFVDVPTSAVAFGVSAAGIGLALRQARSALDEAAAPMAGLAAVFIFAAQMINFPVAAGTSGHLIGAVLAAVLIGPWAGILAMTVVVGAQALVFADGGLTALGLNLFNMAVLPVLFGWFGYRLLAKVLPKSRLGQLTAVAVVAYLSVPLSAASFSLQFALGGTAPVDSGLVFASMLGVHALIGIGEAVVTVLVVSAIAATRSDLIAAFAGAKQQLVLKDGSK